MKEIGNRIKDNYELRNRNYLTRRIPVIIRIDGVAFHSFTKNFQKPFDSLMIHKMQIATNSLIDKIQGFKCAYVQSDEVSILLTDYDTLNTSAWFDYNKSKLESVSASLMTAYFQDYSFKEKTRIIPYFDARAFNIPKEEVVNYFLWRALDWKRNSLHMYASKFFSQKQLFKKNSKEKHEMLHSVGANWTTNLSKIEKNGTFFFKNSSRSDILPTYEDISNVLNPLIYCEKND